MFQFLANICCDTAGPSNMGDSDDGYVLDFGELPDQKAEIIAVGGVYSSMQTFTRRKSRRLLSGYMEIQNQVKLILRAELRVLLTRNLVILQSDPNYAEPNKVLSIFFGCAELGYGSITAHGHADCLSCTLNIGGHPVFVNSGTYDYLSYPKWRSYPRSSIAHNVMVIDGTCNSESLGAFLWRRRANINEKTRMAL